VKQVIKLDLSESDVSNAALTVIATSCPMLKSIDLNSSKTSRMNISSQGLHSTCCSSTVLTVFFVEAVSFS